MTTPNVTELVRNGNPVDKRPLDRQSAPPTAAAANPSR